MGFFFSLHQFSDFALLALRIALGAVFLTHGLGKRKLWSTQPSAQMPTGMLRKLRILSIAEPAGGLGMLVGFLTQLAALGLVIEMLGALQFLISKVRSEEHTSELQSRFDLVCRLLLEKKNITSL